MADKKHHTHADGLRNELRNWSQEKLAAHPTGVDLYAGRLWQLTTDGKFYYSPDGISVKGFDASGGPTIMPPKVIIDNKVGIYDLQQFAETSATSMGAKCIHRVRVHCDALPDVVFANTLLYQPRLELLWYSVRSQRYWYARSGTKARNGWKHPDDMIDGPAYNDGWKGGGTPSYSSGGTPARRRSEWKINTRADLIDVTQGIIGRLTMIDNAFYRDSGGNIQSNLKAVIPVDCRHKNHMLGRRKAWGGNIRDARVAFRISIIEPNAAKPTRIYGPMSEQLIVGSKEHPFIPDVPFSYGGIFYPTAQQNPAFNPDVLAISFGERLP